MCEVDCEDEITFALIVCTFAYINIHDLCTFLVYNIKTCRIRVELNVRFLIDKQTCIIIYCHMYDALCKCKYSIFSLHTRWEESFFF